MYVIYNGDILLSKNFPIKSKKNVKEKSTDKISIKQNINQQTYNIVSYGKANFLGSFEYIQNLKNFHFNAKAQN